MQPKKLTQTYFGPNGVFMEDTFPSLPPHVPHSEQTKASSARAIPGKRSTSGGMNVEHQVCYGPITVKGSRVDQNKTEHSRVEGQIAALSCGMKEWQGGVGDTGNILRSCLKQRVSGVSNLNSHPQVDDQWYRDGPVEDGHQIRSGRRTTALSSHPQVDDQWYRDGPVEDGCQTHSGRRTTALSSHPQVDDQWYSDELVEDGRRPRSVGRVTATLSPLPIQAPQTTPKREVGCHTRKLTTADSECSTKVRDSKRMHCLYRQTASQRYKLASPKPTVSHFSAPVKGLQLPKGVCGTMPTTHPRETPSGGAAGFQYRSTQHGSVKLYHYRRAVNAIVTSPSSGSRTATACSPLQSGSDSDAYLSDYPPSPYESDVWERYHCRSASAGCNLQLKASRPALRRRREVDKLYSCHTAKSHGDFTTKSAGISARDGTIGGRNSRYSHAGDMRSSMTRSHDVGKMSSISPYAISVINPESRFESTNKAHQVPLHANNSPSKMNLEPHKYKTVDNYYSSPTHEDASDPVLDQPLHSESDTNSLCPSSSLHHPECLHYDTPSFIMASFDVKKPSTLSTYATHCRQGNHSQQVCPQTSTKFSPHCGANPTDGIRSSASLLCYPPTLSNESLLQSRDDSNLSDVSTTATVGLLELHPQPRHQQPPSPTHHYQHPNNQPISMADYYIGLLQTLGKKETSTRVTAHNYI